jgi:hypothetical protein
MTGEGEERIWAIAKRLGKRRRMIRRRGEKERRNGRERRKGKSSISP